jgi:hypothetical protein
MITNFAEQVGKMEMGKEWVNRFVARNKDQLITKADSEHKYSLYFNLIECKISGYSVLPKNT